METCVNALNSKGVRPLIRSTGLKFYRKIFQRVESRSVSSKAIIEKRDTSATFDYLALRSSIWDLEERFVPSKVEDVIQYHDQSLSIRLRSVTELKWLTLCWNPIFAHVGMMEKEPRRGAAAELYSLGEGIKRNLRGLVLVDVSMPEKWERVAKLSFSERLEDPPRVNMYIEIMNKHSNLILCDHNNHILIAANQIGSKKSSERQVQTKREYILPPKLRGLAPDDVKSLDDWKECLLSCASFHQSWDIKHCISRSFQGIGPMQAQEMILHANIPAEIDCKSMSMEHWDLLFSAWMVWLKAVENGESYCFLSRHGVLGCSVFRQDEAYLSHTRPLELFGGFFNSSLEKDATVRLLMYLEKVLNKEKAKQLKKLASLQKQADASDNHQEMKLRGDLIMSNLHLVGPRASSIEVENWETGKRECITLDSRKSAIENAEMFYNKAKRAKRGASKITPLIEETQSDLNFLEENEILLQNIRPENLESNELLYQIESDLICMGFVKRNGLHKIRESAAKKAKKKKGPDFRRLTSPNGFEILVGRSSQENDRITMTIAKTGDIWMHARGYPGAHVLMKCSQSVQGVTAEDLQFAADIAAFYSKGSVLSKVDVIMADKKNISKPKGAKPGQVLVHKEQVIVAEPANAAVSHDAPYS